MTLKEHASPYNWEPEAIRRLEGGRRIVVQDLTLEGDGEEMAGLFLSEADKLEIARELDAIGVPRIAVLGNSPRPEPDEVRAAEKIAGLGLACRIGSFAKSRHEIRLAADIGLWGVTVLVGVNDELLPAGWSGDDLIAHSCDLMDYGKELGLHTTFMAMDATRTGPGFLRRVLRAVEAASDEVVIADSLGVASPYGFQHVIELLRSWTTRPIQVHCHNHASMAVANAMAAVVGGASVVHTTVNGLGELAGQVPLEEFAVASEMHLGLATGIDLVRLKALSDLVVRATGVPISVHKPVVGDHAFSIPETEEIQQAIYGLYRQGKLDACLTYPPERVGGKMHMAIGRKCNEYTVRFNLEARGWTADDATVRRIAEAVRRKASAASGHYVMDEAEFMELAAGQDFSLIPFDSGMSDEGAKGIGTRDDGRPPDPTARPPDVEGDEAPASS